MTWTFSCYLSISFHLPATVSIPVTFTDSLWPCHIFYFICLSIFKYPKIANGITQCIKQCPEKYVSTSCSCSRKNSGSNIAQNEVMKNASKSENTHSTMTTVITETRICNIVHIENNTMEHSSIIKGLNTFTICPMQMRF